MQSSKEIDDLRSLLEDKLHGDSARLDTLHLQLADRQAEIDAVIALSILCDIKFTYHMNVMDS